MRIRSLLFLAVLVSPLGAQAKPTMARLSYTATTLTIRIKWTPITWKVPIDYAYRWTQNSAMVKAGGSKGSADTVVVQRSGLGITDTVEACVAAIYESAPYGRACAKTAYSNGTAPAPVVVAPVSNLVVALAKPFPDSLDTSVSFTQPAGTADSTIVTISRTTPPHGGIRVPAPAGATIRQYVTTVPTTAYELLVMACRYASGAVACVRQRSPTVVYP
jgi:hypothetical protein